MENSEMSPHRYDQIILGKKGIKKFFATGMEVGVEISSLTIGINKTSCPPAEE